MAIYSINNLDKYKTNAVCFFANIAVSMEFVRSVFFHFIEIKIKYTEKQNEDEARFALAFFCFAGSQNVLRLT